MGAVNEAPQEPVAPTVDEENTKLKEQVTQLTNENDALSTRIAELTGAEVAEEVGETPQPPVESDELKQLKQELVQENDKLSKDRAVVTEDESVIVQLEQRIAAATPSA